MSKKTKEKHELDEFEEVVHLWNVVPGGSGKGIVLLRKIVDSIQYNFNEPLIRTPSFLISGASGKKLVARALVNSLALDDIRLCPAKYFDNGIYSYQFFWDSIANTAHIITDLEHLKGAPEATLWKFLKNRECQYYNHVNRAYDNILCCNGWIVMTAKDTELINDAMLSAIDYKVKLEPLNLDQLEAIIHQRLVFCNIDYEGDEVLRAMVDIGKAKIELIMQFLKKCLMLMRAEMVDYLDMGIVRKVKRMSGMPVQPPIHQDDDIPF